MNRDEYILDELRSMKAFMLRNAQRLIIMAEQEYRGEHPKRADDFLERALHRALRSFNTRSKVVDKKEIFSLIRDYIEHNEPIQRYFESALSFEKALRDKLISAGLIK